MSVRKFVSSVSLLLIATTGIASAEQEFSAGLRAGTLGLGIEGSWKPLKYLDVRLGGNTFTYDDTGPQAGIDYEQELTLEAYYLTANLLFNDSPMRITFGAFVNSNELYMVNDSLQDQDVGGLVYPGAGIGVLTSTTTFNDTSPYFGIGYDFTIRGKLGMNVDFGVMWQDEPIVELAADGTLAGDPGFQASLEVERRELVNEFKEFKVWPVLQLGVVYRF